MVHRFRNDTRVSTPYHRIYNTRAFRSLRKRTKSGDIVISRCGCRYRRKGYRFRKIYHTSERIWWRNVQGNRHPRCLATCSRKRDEAYWQKHKFSKEQTSIRRILDSKGFDWSTGRIAVATDNRPKLREVSADDRLVVSLFRNDSFWDSREFVARDDRAIYMTVYAELGTECVVIPMSFDSYIGGERPSLLDF